MSEFPAGTGVVYVATGDTYRRDAEQSARSLKLIHPDLPVCLFSDQPSSSNVFDVFVKVENPHRRSKISCMGKSPFQYNLYLDCDTRVVGNVNEPFELLQRFDFAMCLMKDRHPDRLVSKGYSVSNSPACYYPYNSGVMYYRLSPATRQLFEEWDSVYHQTAARLDQIPLREVLWKRPDLLVYNLPVEFNAREISAILATNDKLQIIRVLHLPLFNSKWGKWRRFAKTFQKFQGPVAALRHLYRIYSQ